MPIISVDAARLNGLLQRTYTPEALGYALEQIGCDVDEVVDLDQLRCPACGTVVEAGLGADAVRLCPVCGHSQDEAFPKLGTVTTIRLDLLAARPDLFDLGGLARALRGYLGEIEGLPRYVARPATKTVTVDAALAEEASYRPFIAAAIVHMPALDDATVTALMKVQESLHWGVGRDRKLASIGVYRLDAVTFPVAYTTIDPQTDRFAPLGNPDTLMSGAEILTDHPKGVDYAHLLARHSRYPALIDATGQVLSMPPIINGDASKVKAGTTGLFIDVTGVSQAAVDNTLQVLVCSLQELGGEIEAIEIQEASGATRSSPDLTPRSHVVELERARRWLGLPLDANSLMAALRRMRLDVEPIDDEQTRFTVTAPPYRSDVRHMVDLLEDVAIGYGYPNIVPAMVPSMTISAPRPEEVRSEHARQALFGLGYTEIMSLPLTTEEEHYGRFKMEVPPHARIANPKIKALTVLRSHLMTGVMSGLTENKRRPMPICLFEMDNVTMLDPAGTNGTRDERRLCFVEMGPEAGFSGARTAVDALLFELGATATWAPTAHPSFIPGRTAQIQTDTGITGIVGELHPEVLLAFGLEQPVALVELVLLPLDFA